MKLVIVIVNDQDSANLLKVLIESQFGVTKLATTGGFMRTGNTTFLIGTKKERLDELLEIIKSNASLRKEIITTAPVIGDSALIGMPIEIQVGGATVFVVDIEQHLKI